MSDTATSQSEGTPGGNGTTSDPVRELRQRHAEAVSGVKRRGVKPGSVRGSYNKRSVSPGPAPAAGEPSPAAVESAGHESLNKKMGMVWRAVGHGMALGTNCNVWFLDAEQEKLLGEAYGDLCAHFGLADTLAFKIVFCIGTTVGIMGTKAALYASYRAKLLEDAEKAAKDLKGMPPEKPAAPGPPAEVHESKPGTQ